MGIRFESMSNKEQESMYGPRIIPVGSCFRNEEHYYLQQEDRVLHVNTESALVNSLASGFLNDKGHQRISLDEFKVAMKQVIYELGLNEFWSDQS